ncbi:hypothetical protein D3C73_1146990 [compost metagenome]
MGFGGIYVSLKILVPRTPTDFHLALYAFFQRLQQGAIIRVRGDPHEIAVGGVQSDIAIRNLGRVCQIHIVQKPADKDFQLLKLLCRWRLLRLGR